MKKIVCLIIGSLMLLGSGCASNIADRAAMLNAIADAGVRCKGDGACIATLNAAIYAGGLLQDENSYPRIIASTIPILNVGLELTRLIMGYSGGNGMGGGFVLNRSSGNTFILNRQSADRSSRVDAPFDMTTSNTETYSWENMYNVDRSYRDGVK